MPFFLLGVHRGSFERREAMAVGVLKMLEGDVPGRIVVLNHEKMVLGRHPNCEIVLDNAAVSRRHAQFLENHGTYFVEDLQSRNGTIVNGERIEGRTQLHDTDLVKICNVVLRFHAVMPQASEAGAGTTTLPGDTHHLSPDTAQVTQLDGKTTADDLPPVKMDDSNAAVISSMDASSITHISLKIQPEAKLAAVLAISRELGSAIEVSEVLPRILDTLFQIFPQADRGVVLLRESDSDKLVVKAAKARHKHNDDTVEISQTIIQKAVDTGQAFLSADAGTDKRFDSSESISNFRIRSLMCAPLVGQDGSVMGVIQVDSKTSAPGFIAEDLEILITVACQAAGVVEKAMLFERAETLRDLERELDFATQIQLGFLPTERPQVAGYEFFHYYEAAQSVGGDFFDYVMLGGGKVAITLGDVAGKGVPAALMMARLYADARYHLLMEETAGGALAKLNDDVVRGGHGHRFVTYAGAILDPHTHTLTLANAGHLPPLMKHADGTVERIGVDHANLPLGVGLNLEFEETVIDLAPGDAVILYTDGVTEATNAANDLFGMKRLITRIANAPDSIAELGEQLIADVEEFCGGRPQRDDICLLGFRRLLV